jgi:hypothetical protein
MCASEEEHAHEAEVYFRQDRKRGQSGEDGEGNTPGDPDHHAHVGAVYLPTRLANNSENSAPWFVYYRQRHYIESTFHNLCRALQPLLLVHGANGADQPRLEEGEGSEQVCVERVGILVAVQRDQDDEGRAKRAVKREHARANDERAHGVVVPAHSQEISPRRKRQASFL